MLPVSGTWTPWTPVSNGILPWWPKVVAAITALQTFVIRVSFVFWAGNSNVCLENKVWVHYGGSILSFPVMCVVWQVKAWALEPHRPEFETTHCVTLGNSYSEPQFLYL